MIINILHEKVMTLVEGISVTIAQGNGSSASFEQLWASEDERRKLDIYYREAISDLEKHLMKFLGNSHEQFSLTTNGDEGDYTLKVTVRHWAQALSGLLANKVQDYMVHSVLAGWLNNFSGLEIKSDYASMASQDLSDIRTIVSQKRFNFGTNERTGDNKESSENVQQANERTGDGKDSSENTQHVNSRTDDNKESSENTQNANERTGDNLDIIYEETSTSARKGDSVNKNMIVNHTHANRRKNDLVPTHITHDKTDWSGEGIDVMLMRPHRPNTIIVRDPASPKVTPPHIHHPHHHCVKPEMPPENPNFPDDAPQGNEESEEDTRANWDY